MREQKRDHKIAIIISLIVLFLLIVYSVYLRWQEEKNAFVYEEHLDDIVVTVGEKSVTLREFGYYIAKMESNVQEKALIYNPQDPMEYWNVHFSAGLDSAYMFEYAWKYALADCICDLIFTQKAQSEGHSLSEDGYHQAKIQAEELFTRLSAEQIKRTGLTIESVKTIEERRLLVQSYTKLVMGEDELSGYIDNIMNCISGYDNVVMESEVTYNEELKNNIRMGTITVNYDM